MNPAVFDAKPTALNGNPAPRTTHEVFPPCRRTEGSLPSFLPAGIDTCGSPAPPPLLLLPPPPRPGLQSRGQTALYLPGMNRSFLQLRWERDVQTRATTQTGVSAQKSWGYREIVSCYRGDPVAPQNVESESIGDELFQRKQGALRVCKIGPVLKTPVPERVFVASSIDSGRQRWHWLCVIHCYCRVNNFLRAHFSGMLLASAADRMLMSCSDASTRPNTAFCQIGSKTPASKLTASSKGVARESERLFGVASRQFCDAAFLQGSKVK